MYLELVIDNTLVVPEQPFNEKVVVTRDDMKELRAGFDAWLEEQGDQDTDI